MRTALSADLLRRKASPIKSRRVEAIPRMEGKGKSGWMHGSRELKWAFVFRAEYLPTCVDLSAMRCQLNPFATERVLLSWKLSATGSIRNVPNLAYGGVQFSACRKLKVRVQTKPTGVVSTSCCRSYVFTCRTTECTCIEMV